MRPSISKYSTIVALILSCGEEPKSEEAIEPPLPQEKVEPQKAYIVKSALQDKSEETSEKWWMEYPWDKAVRPITFDNEGRPIAIQQYDRSYYRIGEKTRLTTIEIHRQVAAALGLELTEERSPDLAKFLTARASVETSLQGNQRPFDTRGSIHGLDVSAAYRAGIRVRGKYIEAGNELAKDRPWIFLGYGQGGMISWLFLDNWDILGDPRMLGDSVIGAITYQRSLVKKYEMLSSTKIRCYEYSDEGKEITHSFSDKTYKVRSFAVDEEKYQACIDDGPHSKAERSNPGLVEDRCYSRSRKSYAWKPGEPQPENTVPVPEITWWELKRASNGKPCPPWKKDSYEKFAKSRFEKRAKRYGLDVEKVVRRRDLGYEPDDLNQYELWMKIWDSTMLALGEEPINWENLRDIGVEELIPASPSPEKIEQERKRARGEDLNPYASRAP